MPAYNTPPWTKPSLQCSLLAPNPLNVGKLLHGFPFTDAKIPVFFPVSRENGSHSTAFSARSLVRLQGGRYKLTMSYVAKHLIDGESIAYETRLHWVVLLVPLLLSLLFDFAGAALLVLPTRSTGGKSVASEGMLIAGVALLAIGTVFLARGVLLRNATEMTVTNKRVFVKVGLAARRTVELLLSRVESIGVEETVMGRMLGYGTVIVRGTGGTPEVFNMVDHPLEFRTQVQQQIEKSQAK